ncbi:MAG: transporter permease [Frankiales bacterium]|nr:transporter permease [Frankiales bacterium]
MRLRALPFTKRDRGLRRAGIRRVVSLGRAEALLLRRNPMALAVGLGMPLGLTAALQVGQPAAARAQVDAADSIILLAAFALLSVLYYNLVTALVARRQDFVLKRLRAGELTDEEVLAGSALPAAAVAWGQIVIATVAGFAFFRLDAPVNPVLVVTGLILGTVVFALLAAVVATVTRSVEMAQLTAMPVLVLSAVVGVLVPAEDISGPLHVLAQALPMPQVLELLHLGFTGSTSGGASVDVTATFGHAVTPVIVLLTWAGAARWATRRWFRWEPRG